MSEQHSRDNEFNERVLIVTMARFCAEKDIEKILEGMELKGKKFPVLEYVRSRGLKRRFEDIDEWLSPLTSGNNIVGLLFRHEKLEWMKQLVLNELIGLAEKEAQP